jgi:peptidyl-prolyl cis-trans isomerase SurA
MKIGDRTVPAGAFVHYLVEKQAPRRSENAEPFVQSLYEEFVRDRVIAYEDANLANKYPEFKYIYQEYHDGILLFDIMDQKVWSKAVNDSAGLEAFHRQHRNDYMWGNRYDAIIVTCSQRADLEQVRKAYKKIARGKLDENDLNDHYCTSDTIKCITLENLLVEKGVNEMVDAMNGESGLGPVTSSDSTEAFVILKEVHPPEPKALSDARGQITSDYQNYLEEKWIADLKNKYTVEVNTELLSGIKP